MSEETCILTTKDLTILEIMLDTCLGRDDPMAPLLRRKIGSALVMFRDDVPENVATLSSRVAFSVDGGESDTRVISHDRTTSPVGLFLPITTPRGLALLGLPEGQEFELPTRDGGKERVLLEKVLYQPEAAKRDADSMTRLSSARDHPRPTFKLIRGALYGAPGPAMSKHDGFDDPGPSVA